MTDDLARFDRFQRLMGGARKLTGDGQEGSHTDVLRFDADAVAGGLAGLPEARDPERDARLAAWIAERYLVKKGKIQYFAQPLLGSEPTRIRRSTVSWVFGPLGFSVLPTFEKVMADATEAARVMPYLGHGPLDGHVAPDLVDALETGCGDEGPAPNRQAVLVRTFLDGADLKETAFRILDADPFFHDPVVDANGLAEFQRYVRRNPLTPAMEERFAAFFESPLTVGVRDTLRWMKGSRHPRMPWERARGFLRRAFDRWGHESFILPEITYYTYDTERSADELAALFARNAEVARAFAADLEARLPEAARASFRALGPLRLAFQLLDFHTDYPLYEVEPYAGFLSASSARAAGRLGAGLLIETAGLPVPGGGNLDLGRLPRFHTGLAQWFGQVPPRQRSQLFEHLGGALATYRRRGVRGLPPKARFERIPRTFYTFQQRADLPLEGGRVRRLLTVHELWKPENAHVWTRFPELSEKLAVFFTLVYRHFHDTGYVADLRPRDSGRDIFIYGLWGTVTENLMVVEEEVGGREQVRVVFVDNRDQFKSFRGEEDRRHPIGMAKYALRLVHPIIEPALLRSVGVFVEDLRRREEGEVDRTPKGLVDAAVQGLDIARQVAKDSVDQAFVGAKAAVDDLIDDAHTGAKRALGGLAEREARLRRGRSTPTKES